MDEGGNGSPSPVNSLHLNGRIYDLSKKRKLRADPFGLPISKHKCWDHRLSPKPLAVSEANQQIEDLSTCTITKETAEGQAIEYGSEPESAKDSNSFAGYYESATSVHSDAKFETDGPKLWPSNASSTSEDWSSNKAKDNQCLLEDVIAMGVSAEDEPVYGAEEHDPYHYYNEIQAYQNLDDPMVEIGCIEPFIDNDFDNILNSNKVKPNLPVLSSGSWSVNQDAGPGRKPTIDQEFEQYFSMLML